MPKKPLPVYNISDFKLAELQGNHFYINRFSEHIKQHDFVAKPHRHDFYLVVFFAEGTGTHLIDFVEFEVEPGSLFFLSPGQVHNFSDIKQGAGTILFFSAGFLETYFQGKRVSDYAIFGPGCQKLRLDDTTIDWMQNTLAEMMDEYSQPRENGTDITRDLLDILLKRLGRLAPAKTAPVPGRTAAWQLRELQNLIELHHRTQHSPSAYAERLHLSPKYLNELCKKHLHKTTTQIIHERLVLEAKRLLVHEENTISDIASELGFEDASYFIRLFKKTEGLSPKKFRKEQDL